MGVNAASTSCDIGASASTANPTQEPSAVVIHSPMEGGVSVPIIVPTVAVENDGHIMEQVTIGSELVLFQDQQNNVPSTSMLVGSPSEQLSTCNSFEILTNDDSNQIQITSEALVVRQRWADLVEDNATTMPADVPKKKAALLEIIPRRQSVVGNGENIDLWRDNWLQPSSIKSILNLSSHNLKGCMHYQGEFFAE
ncbi:hypothetical protein IFM89_015772 [Coptis chinensis]|uniref:Uncharacterized protein n=1 Tax=Coptis chinensis TaxID=261450 RepID=A0A835H431_9MAGN|nr:hypothetical protein IFM89_015772 [Coptis chinensis]